jgi:caa(3)-type oxidase subunit IV
MNAPSERGSIVTPFLVALGLAALTLGMVLLRSRAPGWLLAGLIAAIVIQLALVSLYSMHLRWEGKLIGVMLLPVALLAVVLILCLLPDGLYASWYDRRDEATYSARMTEALSP